MIFVTVGTHPCGFNRLVQAADECARQLAEEFWIQIGPSTYKPVYAGHFRFAHTEEMDDYYRRARVVVAHAGAGTMISAFRQNAAVIVVPRRKQFGEHLNDHQVELATKLDEIGRARLLGDPSGLLPMLQSAEVHPNVDHGATRQRLLQHLSDWLTEHQVATSQRLRMR